MSKINYQTEVKIGDDDALIVVDLQPDFMPGGNLSVEGGDEIIGGINELLPKFTTVVVSQDWHPEGHKSFASSHNGKKPYDLYDAPGLGPVLWPVHCVQGTTGAECHPDFHMNGANLIIRKGVHLGIDSYSTFRENDEVTETGLSGYLKTRKIRRIFLCGLALDYCVLFSAEDGIEMGFEVVVIIDLSRAVDSPAGHKKMAIEKMKEIGVEFILSETLS